MKVTIDAYNFYFKENILLPNEYFTKKNIGFLKLFNKNFQNSFKTEKELEKPKKILDNNINQLVNLNNIALEVTENCNLRCRYCVYSGIYSDQRNRSEKKMPFETARKTINFFFKWVEKHFEQRTSPLLLSIGFYGGEPFMNFGLIEQVVNYYKKYKKSNKLFLKNNAQINFIVTTNGVITERYIKFIIENNFKISISLDGPKDITEKNRGENTFGRTMEFILHLYKNYPLYYKKNVSIIAVYMNDSDLRKISEFFSQEIFEKCVNLTFGNVNQFGLNDNTLIINPRQGNRKFVDKLFKKVKNGESLKRIEKSILYKDFQFKFNIINPNFNQKEWEWCTQGSKRLFVDVSGNFYGCEKVGRSFKIGNVDEGFNLFYINSLDNFWLKRSKKCISCINKNFCSPCLANMGLNKQILFDRYCINSKEEFQKGVKKYVDFLKI